MKANELLNDLSVARPSLGGSDSVVPLLSHFCFDGDSAYASNDVTTVIVPCKIGLECALHGETLLGLLSASGSAEVSIKRDKDGVVQMKGSGGWIKIPSLPLPESDVLQIPDGKPLAVLPLSEEVLLGLQRCTISVGTDALKAEFAGVTIAIDSDGVTFYATDNRSASRFRCQEAMRKSAVAAVLPLQTCELLLKLAPGSEGQINLFKSALVAQLGDDVTLVSRTLEAKPSAFETVFKAHEHAEKPVLIPEELSQEIAKACVLLAADGHKQVTLAFGKGEVEISAQGTLGSMSSRISVTSRVSASITTDPQLIARALPHVERMVVNDGASLVLTKSGFTHIIAQTNK